MTVAAKATESVSLLPTLVTVFGTLATALAIALVTYALANRRDHGKWLREEKLKRYDRFASAYLALNRNYRTNNKSFSDAQEELLASAFSLAVIAPPSIYRQARDVVIAAKQLNQALSPSERNFDEVTLTHRKLTNEMRTDLGVKEDVVIGSDETDFVQESTSSM